MYFIFKLTTLPPPSPSTPPPSPSLHQSRTKAMVGEIDRPRPSHVFGDGAKYSSHQVRKWDAWKALEHLTRVDAMDRYIALVASLDPFFVYAAQPSRVGAPSSPEQKGGSSNTPPSNSREESEDVACKATKKDMEDRTVSSSLILSGFLFKRGDMWNKRWRERYFTLHDDTVTYFLKVRPGCACFCVTLNAAYSSCAELDCI